LAIKVDIIYNKHILDALKEIPDNSIDTIVTSPPYWGLRDYGEDTKTQWSDGWYGQLGLEPTLDLYIEHLLQITKELKRVLKPTGVMFWNHGDCYGSSPPGNSRENIEQWANKGDGLIGRKFNRYGDFKKPQSIKQKCLALQNYRLILRMIDEQGWILRNIIIWYKPNHMPSSVKDRFTNAYEPVFMLTKKRKYWFDLDAVRVPHKDIQDYQRHAPFNYRVREAKKGHSGIIGIKASKEEMERYDTAGRVKMSKLPNPQIRPEHDMHYDGTGYNPAGKNPGDVWTIATQPFPEAHFATFPEKLVEPMIRCACPKWICKKCGKARVRIVKYGNKHKENLVWGRNAKGVDAKELASYLKQKIQEKGITVKQLEKMLTPRFIRKEGKKIGRVRHWLSGNSIPMPDDWKLLQKILGLDKYEWLGIQQGKQKRTPWGDTNLIIGNRKKVETITSEIYTIGWTDCGCNAGFDAGIVLDPFAGAGTTLVVAKKLGRHYIGIEIKKEYCEMAKRRLEGVVCQEELF